MATDALPTHHSQQRHSPYRSNGTWQIVLAIILVPVWLLVLMFSALGVGFCSDWGTEEECADVGRGAAIRVGLFAVAIILLFVIGVIRRIRSSPSSTLDSRRLASISALFGAATLAMLLATMSGGIGFTAQLGLLSLATVATTVGVAALINLPSGTRTTRNIALAAVVVALVSLVVGLIL